ncbi:hypothetical protein ACMU_04220 [Actibacterium mucosum KCTC 23349]|uniref:Uncharacterized protein n=1 Tax=Actibacterium mucosum KCTC 23349 TaxID=1454373 RepID=A0A037ZC86_9RHOB|nr:hypothetical protein [Actibacterium mucosum]KAJ54109.1 hypothetical protein ACMU_04220 [Actibacterium mucosum KCTC 23349]
MTPDQIVDFFTRPDGSYAFARWGRPIAPVVFGVADATLEVLKGALEAVAALSGHKLAETDPELGANLMFFFFEDWDELVEVPNLEQLVPDLAGKVAELKGAGANQYRFFRFDDDGAIQAAFVFLRMDAALSAMAAEDVALAQVVQVMLLWGPGAFAGVSPLAHTPEGAVILRPEVAAVLRAAYDPVMPVAAKDASHALRLAARMGAVE